MLFAAILIVAVLLLLKSNVTFSYEPKIGDDNLKNRALEINSDLVQSLYSKLTILDDSLLTSNYKYAYFKMSSPEKELSAEEKLYITIENMYTTNILELKREDDIYKTRIKAEEVLDQAKRLFKDEGINPNTLNFEPSSNCGIVSYLYTGEHYELSFKKCDTKEEVNKTELVSAKKEDNYVILRLKSLYATYKEKTKKEKEGHYLLKNYNSEDVINTVDENKIDEELEKTIKSDSVDEYDFYFELRGEDYYLSKIRLLKKD